ncbi:hypothetical protein LOTGIDRAFT_129978 [Lottia gigantea]|uniref:Serine/threonine-protein kinase RIO3 n=1 Tax=Lottia gigantea TaxID=225164 RepID=V3ZYJ4_LOTGI|nr:hypothetical protein LOTGIDRAFT_129978 [Lottia gigantea]ESO86056.1 hypothetical protein LOTGIDRAFT_129978 [Lottia gigantea]
MSQEEIPKSQTSAWSAPPKSPWGQPTPVIPCSLSDVMSEQLASKIQSDQELKLAKKLEKVAPKEPQPAQASPETVDDLKIAQMLQLQFDKEQNEMLAREAKKFNGESKVSISFDNYKARQPVEPVDDEYIDDSPDEEVYEPKSGFIDDDGVVKSKHDAELCGRKNAEKIMKFHPEFLSGDAEKMNLVLPNHIYNKLRHFSQTGSKQYNRVHEKAEKATADQVVDPRTRILLFKLVNSGVLDSVTGSISAGKEAAVFHAFGGVFEGKEMPKECAIKIFKTSLNEFKNRQQYIVGDHRFLRDDFKKLNPRKILRIWAEKEVANLNRMRKFDMPCPTVVAIKKHLLVMSFIGNNTHPAPKLKDVKLSTVDIQDAYEQTLEIMKKLQKECCLVHADLSEFNLLWHDGKVWVIDVGQAVDLTHPRANEFLYRDCSNITKYFKKEGVVGVCSPEQLFNKITGWEVKGTGVDFLSQVISNFPQCSLHWIAGLYLSKTEAEM